MTQYKFYVTDTLATTEVFPIGFEKSKFIFRREKNVAYVKINFNGTLNFSNRPKSGIFDFDYFVAKDVADLRCEELTFVIKQSCDGVAYTDYWTGVFEIVEGEFDLDTCTFSVQPRLKDYIFADREINIVGIPGSFSVIAGDRTFPRCKNLSTILTYFATDVSSGLTGIVSDFFQINPVTTSLVNYVTGTTNKYRQLAITPLSEVQEPLPSDPATVEMATFNQIMDDLLVLFDVHWFVDSSLNIRIEHYTYFDGVPGLDLTIAPYDKFLVAKNKYSYDEDDAPKSEVFKTYNSFTYGKFIYGTCGDLNKDETLFSTSIIATDYYTIRYETGGESTKGLFLFATETITGQKYMFGNEQNEELVIPRLALRFHRHGRPSVNNVTFEYFPGSFDFTESDYGDVFIYSEKPTRKQVKISFPRCCGEDINLADSIKTPLGDKGFIQDYEFRPSDNMVSAQLKYKINADLPDIVPSDLPGLQLWLESDIGVTLTAGRVSSWADQSGNGRDATQGTAAFRPTVTAGPYIRFAGTYFLATPAFQLFPGKRGTVFFLHKKDYLSLGQNIYLSTNGGAGNFWDLGYNYNGIGSPNDEHRLYDNTNALLYPAYGYVNNVQRAYEWGVEPNLVEIARTADTTNYVWLNGKPVDAANGNPMTIPNVQPDINPLIIGDNSFFPAMGCNGDVMAVIIYDRVLTDVERQKVEQYLSKKWLFNLYTLS
ncbi:MAG: hypothetical protein M3R27_05830 [Bacteroidota bacterium]|nr:hypothetical protein [Bacteroidota bacterium]